MNRERLSRLADYLENSNLADVRDVAIDEYDSLDVFDMRVWRMEKKCGTAACVLGWAAYNPEFREEGLVLDCEMAEEFFGLTESQADDLFLGFFTDKDLYEITKQEVVDYIRNVLLA